tara:strand:- start:393 stop:608 length:216 start_codon:yes stop_codon:yes gene_type:complete
MKQLLKSTATFTVPMGPVQGYMNETPDGPAKREKLDPFTSAEYGDGITAAPSVSAKMVDPAIFKMADERDY